jgi:radical SAM protein with 4Fe4S-binding SPASM domain
MRLLEQLLPRIDKVRVRPPDHVEQRDGLFLQVWGHEGYWQVVDGEFRDLLKAAETSDSLESILGARPQWRPHRRSIQAQLGAMRKAGLMGTPGKPAPPPLIENVTINLTAACNLSCRTCYVPREVRAGARLDTDRLLPFLDKLQACFSPAATISLLGGEPFLHPNAVLAVGRWAKRHKLICNVSTNGTAVPEAMLKDIAEAGLKVQVSIDGATAATNDFIRGASTFEKAVLTVRRLVASGIPTTLCMVCCQQNVAEIPAYFALARELGAEQIRFIPLKMLGNSKAGSIAPAPQLQIVKAICRELDAHPDYRQMCRSDLFSIISSMLRESSQRRSCGSGTQTLLLDADGSVYPCINTTLPRLRLGNIADAPKVLLARGGQFGETLDISSSAHPCHACYVKRWCLAGCPGETLQQEGSLSRRHWNCQDLQQTISFVMWHLAQQSESLDKNTSRTWI